MFTTRENRRAATIINKAIAQSSNILNGVVLAQNSVSEKKMTLQDVLTEYAGFVIGVSFVIIFVLLLLLYFLSVSRKKQMEALKEMLYAATKALKPGGRLVVITIIP